MEQYSVLVTMVLSSVGYLARMTGCFNGLFVVVVYHEAMYVMYVES